MGRRVADLFWRSTWVLVRYVRIAAETTLSHSQRIGRLTSHNSTVSSELVREGGRTAAAGRMPWKPNDCRGWSELGSGAKSRAAAGGKEEEMILDPLQSDVVPLEWGVSAAARRAPFGKKGSVDLTLHCPAAEVNLGLLDSQRLCDWGVREGVWGQEDCRYQELVMLQNCSCGFDLVMACCRFSRSLVMGSQNGHVFATRKR
ncbi:hypothetical protein HDK64DRAFT_270139 [Phyllosticta capitalensis]